jgi:hypothetical protein
MWTRAQNRSLGSSAFSTGYLLLATVLFLALYNARKKLPFMPLGTSATWLQWHIYAGLGSVGLFALHAGIPWPTGLLNSALAGFYLTTVASGLIGLYLTRSIPQQLSRVGTEVIFERIPILQKQVRSQAGSVVLESVAASGATTFADFYTTRLFDFFHRPRGMRYFLRPTTARRRSLMHELTAVQRYLSDHEQTACEQMFALLRRKDDLDFHEARQRLLKNWLFVHIGLTYGLVALALLHGLLALAFRGGGV